MAGETDRLYPDVVAAGGLSKALQAGLDRIGSRLFVADRTINLASYTRVESTSRFSQVYIAVGERLFLFDCWNRGVVLAYGKTSRLDDLALAIDRWVGSDCTTGEMATEFGFVAPEPAAGAYERGAEVEHRWRGYLADVGERFPELAAFVRVAAGRPELRQLFPYTSLNTFCFSRCTGYPFSYDTPSVRPQPDGRYEVVGRDGRVLGRGDAEAAADVVARHLPPGCGPAVAGTADDL